MAEGVNLGNDEAKITSTNSVSNAVKSSADDALQSAIPETFTKAKPLKINPLEGTRYSPKVQSQMQKGDYHSFPKSVDSFAGEGTVTVKPGGDGIIRTYIDLPGSYKGKSGNFEWIIEPDNSIKHRVFNSQ